MKRWKPASEMSFLSAFCGTVKELEERVSKDGFFDRSFTAIKKGDHLLFFYIKKGYHQFRLTTGMTDWFILQHQGLMFHCVALPFGRRSSSRFYAANGTLLKKLDFLRDPRAGSPAAVTYLTRSTFLDGNYAPLNKGTSNCWEVYEPSRPHHKYLEWILAKVSHQ